MTEEEIVNIFKSFNCDTCPIKRQCDNLEKNMRQHSTSTYSICEVILDGDWFVEETIGYIRKEGTNELFT